MENHANTVKEPSVRLFGNRISDTLKLRLGHDGAPGHCLVECCTVLDHMCAAVPVPTERDASIFTPRASGSPAPSPAPAAPAPDPAPSASSARARATSPNAVA